jgi:hypothetical protein
MHSDPSFIKQAVADAVAETFETMIFTQVAVAQDRDGAIQFAESVTDENGSGRTPPDQNAHAESFYQVEIHLTDPEKVLFYMIFPTNLAVAITKNLYGWMEEDDPPRNLVQDSLTEVINTVAGKLMTILIDDHSTFSLGLPSFKALDEIAPYAGDVYVCQTEDGFRFIMAIDWMQNEKKTGASA